MPPKRKKSVRQKQKQRQSQRQSVVVNIGKTTTTKRRRNAGRGGLPPPSHLQNLAPTFITTQQIDIPSLLNALKVQDPPRIPNPVTPLSATLQASTQTGTAQQMAGQRAEERRAGPTAGNFQPHPSKADNRLAQAVQQQDDDDVRSAFKAKLFSRARSASPVLATQVRPRRGPIPRGIQEAVPVFEPGGGGGGPPVVTPSSARPILETQADGTPITKKETKAQKAKREKAEAEAKAQKNITQFF